MPFLKNTWYAALWLQDLPEDKPFGRIIAGEPIVFWRTADGTVAANEDVCPHRRAKLSVGGVRDGKLTCLYHGLGFDGAGKCAVNPHGPVVDSLNIRSYPVEIQDEMIWVWTGAPELADVALIPQVLAFTRTLPETGFVRGSTYAKASHKLFEDNILDPGHADFLHPYLGSGALSRSKRTIEEGENSLKLNMFQANWRTPAVMIGEFPSPDIMTDQWAEVDWNPNGAMLIRTGATPTGRPESEGIDTWTAHIFTAETETTTHYLYASGRTYKTDDAGFNEGMRQGLRYAFEAEDLPMVESQQANLGDRDLMESRPALFAIDTASVRARRLFDKLVAAETAEKVPENA